MVDVKEQPEVSVIMNCLNYAHYLPEALDSVYAQTYDNWEIIFWDNASTDNSAEIARSYDSKVRYFRSDQTYPLSKARNLAFKEVRGDYIAVLDCDDLWLPTKLEKQIRFFKQKPHLGMTFSNSIFFNAEGDQFSIFQSISPKRGYVFGDLLLKNFISSETMIFRKSALNQLNHLFNETYTIVMDYDLTLRIAYHFEIDYIEEPLSKWRMHNESASNKKRFVIPYETLKMLENLIDQNPDISTRFSDEIALFRKALSYDFGLEAWFKGDRQALRRHLKPYLGDKKFLLTYIVSSFLSFSDYERMKPRLRQALLRLKQVGQQKS